MEARGMQLQPYQHRTIFGIILLITTVVLLAFTVTPSGALNSHHAQHAWRARTAGPATPQEFSTTSDDSDATAAAAAGAAYTFVPPVSPEVEALCGRWGLKPAAPGTKLPSVFDCFIAGHELDMFEIRLHELHDVVDHTLIVESRQTFRGKPKQLAYPRMLSSLPGAVTSKIHYTVLDQLEGNGAWEKESFQRNSMLHIALNRSGILPHPDDIFIISDLDEIPKPDFIRAMKLCSGISYPATLVSNFHYYAFNVLKGEQWEKGPRAMLASQKADISPQKLRMETPVTQYQNASWHCSYCFKTLSMFNEKLSSFSHAEFDTPFYHDTSRIVKCLVDGYSLFSGNLNKPDAQPDFKRIPEDQLDVPRYMRDNRQRFEYLFGRTGPTASLSDVIFVEGIPKAVQPSTEGDAPYSARSNDTMQRYRALRSAAWLKTPWGKDCINPHSLTPGQQAMCQLPHIWKDCTQGIYIDLGTNVGTQIRKLYDAWQFPEAVVLGLFNATYGFPRSGVCAIGFEPNPAHKPYLTKLNAFFRQKGYQAIVLTETAASISTGPATFYMDPGSPVEWGASLASGPWQNKPANTTNNVTVWTLDLPAFVANVVRPMVVQDQADSGKRPPAGMKMDVEGEEQALLPALITNGALCDLSMIALEPHPDGRSETGKAVQMTLASIEDAFAKMRRVNSECKVQYTHMDDETYLHADRDVPLPE